MNPISKTRMLFVDDEPLVLDLLRLVLKPMSGQWDMAFVTSGREALARMAERPFEVVVSDMRMPAMTGAQLLNEVWKLYPSTFRLIQSGYADENSVLQCVGVVHQFLLKPFTLEGLKSVLQRIDHLKRQLSCERIRTLVTKKGLPSAPAVYKRIIDLLQDPNCSLDQVGECVSQDPGFTAQLLQLVNSAFFGFAREVSNATEAVMLLGVGTIRSLALSLHLFSSADLQVSEDFSLERIWTHSLRVGQLARRIVELEQGDQKLMEQAFTAGIKHDVSKLILANNLSQRYLDVIAQSRKQNRLLIEAEREVLKATHADIGAYLLDLWGLPTLLVEAVALHHEPGKTSDLVFSPLTAVHAANALEHETGANEPGVPLNRLDTHHLDQLGLADHLEFWRENCVSANAHA